MAKGWRKSGDHLTAGERQRMPSSDFALPGRGEGPKGAGSGSYPIDTAARARSALSRSAANASASEQAEIRRKVASKYPSMSLKDRANRRYSKGS